MCFTGLLDIRRKKNIKKYIFLKVMLRVTKKNWKFVSIVQKMK